MSHLKVYLLPNAPAVFVPDVEIVEPPPKARRYAACGWACFAIVYDEINDKWLGFWKVPIDTTITSLIAEGKVLKATKPYHQW